MSIKLIAIDLDGTLLDSEHMISDAVKESIAYAQSKGVQVVIATGRPYNGAMPYIQESQVHNERNYCILNNGSLVQDFKTGEILHQNLLSYDDYLNIETLSHQFPVALHVISDDCIYTANQDIGHYTVYESFLSNMPLKYRAREDMPSDIPYIKCLFSAEPSILELVVPQIPQAFRDEYEVVQSASFYLEFLRRASSKGNALKKIMDQLGLTAKDVMCIGDHENDFSMFQTVETKVAMGNAIDLLKDNATFITETNDNHGVAIAIREFI